MFIDTVLHRWLRIPYTLRVQIHRRRRHPKATLLFVHGIGASGQAWHNVIERLPEDVTVATVDLLGFGQSPRPEWAVYNARRQAQSVIYSCRKRGILGPIIIVGHSMGALVAIEIATQQPRFVSSLILCSPPFYVPSPDPLVAPSQAMLRSLYASIQARPDRFVKISRIAAKYGLLNRGFQVDEANVGAYMNALEASIVNQTAYDDAQALRQPISILYGTLDAVVIVRHLKRLARHMPHVTLKAVAAAHEIKGAYTTAVVRTITEVISQSADSRRRK